MLQPVKFDSLHWTGFNRVILASQNVPTYFNGDLVLACLLTIPCLIQNRFKQGWKQAWRHKWKVLWACYKIDLENKTRMWIVATIVLGWYCKSGSNEWQSAIGKKFFGSMGDRTPVCHILGEHHAARRPRHPTAITFTPSRRKHVLMHFETLILHQM